jgi:hypothetical protein
MECKLKHLEFIQGIITRLGTNTFILKGWTITVGVALVSLTGNSSTKLSIVGLFMLSMFWVLDAYYVSLERKYRALYDEVRIRIECDFDLSILPYKTWKHSPFRCLFSVGLLAFHGSIVFLFCVYMIISCQY